MIAVGPAQGGSVVNRETQIRPKLHVLRSIIAVIPELVEDKWYELPPQSACAASGMGAAGPAMNGSLR
jgi:hypothetical protein